MIRFLKFGLVGIANTFITISVFAFLVMVLKLNYLWANMISYFCGMLNSYICNKNWVFQVKDSDYTNYLKFITLNIVMLILNTMALYFLVEGLHFNKLASQVLVTFSLTALNYLFTKNWIFSLKESK